jgi:hypothetical protein
MQPDPAASKGAKGYVVILPAPGVAPIRVLKDRFSAVSPVLSPDGTRFAFDDYGLASDDTRPECKVRRCRQTKLVVADWRGHILLATPTVMARTWGSSCESFDVVEWVDEDRIGVGCYGPTNYTYSTILVPSGKVGVSYVSWLETDFRWSPDRQHVAYAANLPHWPPNGIRSDEPAIDSEIVTERDKHPDIAVHSLSDLVWSPDGQRIAWIDGAQSCPPGRYNSEAAGDDCELRAAGMDLAIAGLHAGYWTMALPAGCAFPGQEAVPRWIDATHVEIRCTGGLPISVSDKRLKSHVHSDAAIHGVQNK